MARALALAHPSQFSTARMASSARRRIDPRLRQASAVVRALAEAAEAEPASGAGLINAAAGVLALAVMADSAIEHFRGSYKNPAMFVAPTVSAVTVAAACGALGGRQSRARKGVFAAAVAAGLIGTGFHIYNVGKREGGFRWLNLFYGAPLGAPGAIAMAGVYGLAASELAKPAFRRRGPLRWLADSRLLALSAVGGLLGTIAEVGLLHFRGDFQNPFMYVPVTLPPAATGALAAAILWPVKGVRRAADLLLKVTGVVGTIGMGFHAYGVHRCMGGWRNWRQNAVDGPPLPAPLGFLGMALAGLGALALMERES